MVVGTKSHNDITCSRIHACVGGCLTFALFDHSHQRSLVASRELIELTIDGTHVIACPLRAASSPHRRGKSVLTQSAERMRQTAANQNGTCISTSWFAVNVDTSGVGFCPFDCTSLNITACCFETLQPLWHLSAHAQQSSGPQQRLRATFETMEVCIDSISRCVQHKSECTAPQHTDWLKYQRGSL